jgi:hypothetical protein
LKINAKTHALREHRATEEAHATPFLAVGFVFAFRCARLRRPLEISAKMNALRDYRSASEAQLATGSFRLASFSHFQFA